MTAFNTYTSPFSTGTTRENFESRVNLLSQMEVPFYSSIGRGTTTSRAPQLFEDELNAAGSNAQVEGFQHSTLLAASTSATVPASVSDTRRSFNTQIFAKAVQVTASSENTNHATVTGKKELAEQLALRGMELKRDIEWACVSVSTGKGGSSVNGGGSAGSATTARFITDAWNQIAPATTNGSTGNIVTGDTFEDAINAVAEDLYTSGGLSYNMGNAMVKNANMMVMAPATKRILDNRLDAKSNVRRDIGNMKMLNTSYSKYGSSFGDFAIVPDAFASAADVLLYNPQNWKFVTLQAMHVEMIAKTGNAENRQVVIEGTLIHRHTAASGKISGITTS